MMGRLGNRSIVPALALLGVASLWAGAGRAQQELASDPFSAADVQTGVPSPSRTGEDLARSWVLSSGSFVRTSLRVHGASSGAPIRCLGIDFEAPGGSRAGYELMPESEGRRTIQVRKDVEAHRSESCFSPLGKGGAKPAFRLFVSVSARTEQRSALHGEPYLRVVALDWPASKSTQLALSEITWSLQISAGDDWTEIARSGPGVSLGDSGWAVDPDRPDAPALVLADPATVAEARAEPSRTRQRALPRSAFEFAVKRRYYIEPKRLFVGLSDPDTVPSIRWHRGQTLGRLYLERVEALSDAESGRYCVRAVYDENGVRRMLERGADGVFSIVTDRPAAPPPAEDCRPTTQLLFPIHVNGSSGEHDLVRFVIDRPHAGADPSALLSLADTRVRLNASDSSGYTVAAHDPVADGAGPSGWFVTPGGDPALYIEGADVQRWKISLRYTPSGEKADGELVLNGTTWPRGEVRDELEGEIRIGWNSAVPPRRASLCGEDADGLDCFARLPIEGDGIAFDSSELFHADIVTVAIDWSVSDAVERADQGAAETGEADARPVVTGVTADGSAALSAGTEPMLFEPSVAFGAWERPLTSCLGRLHAGDLVSEPFALRRGMQVFDQATLPATLADDTAVQVRFDRSRSGGDCPIEGLAGETTTLGALREQGRRGSVAVSTRARTPLFVGYLQLNARPYADSLARWKNALEFFARLYASGHERGDWSEGVVFGAGERGGVAPLVAPSANFVTTLGDADTLRDTARSRRDRAYSGLELFADQVDALGETFGDAPIRLVYYDDLSNGCDFYADDLEAGRLSPDKAIVIAGMDGFTATDGSLRALPGALAHVCAESPGLRVYGFNWRERADNEDFGKMLETVLEDVSPDNGARN